MTIRFSTRWTAGGRKGRGRGSVFEKIGGIFFAFSLGEREKTGVSRSIKGSVR